MITASTLFEPLQRIGGVSPEAQYRLEKHLTSSGKLTELLKEDSVFTADLQRMLLLEANRPEGPRYVIVRKLVARILSRERDRMVTLAYGSLKPRKTNP